MPDIPTEGEHGLFKYCLNLFCHHTVTISKHYIKNHDNSETDFVISKNYSCKTIPPLICN